MSKSAIREAIAALGVITSMLFVGWEIRQSNAQARGAAYQEIGLATAEIHLRFDDRLSGLEVDQTFDAATRMADWTPVDWNRVFHEWLGVLRVWETLYLQVEQGVLPPESLENLGWGSGHEVVWGSLGFVCLWPALKANTSSPLGALIEGARPDGLTTCPVEVSGVPGF